MIFKVLDSKNENDIREMSAMASSIVKEYYDPLLGAAQNDYMIEMFQSPHAIVEQLSHGYMYYFACVDDIDEGGGYILLFRIYEQHRHPVERHSGNVIDMGIAIVGGKLLDCSHKI